MVVIRELIDNEVNMKTTFDVTRFTSFLQKDNSFLTPWSWDPNTSKNEINSSTKEKEYLSSHPESYFSYQIIDQERRNNAQIINYNQCRFSERLHPQVIYNPVPLMFYNQAPTYASPTYCNQTPTYCNQAYANPTYCNQAPTYASPTYCNPTYANPTYCNPTYAAPTYCNQAPTYCNPTYYNQAPPYFMYPNS